MKSKIKFKTFKMRNPIKNIILKLSYISPSVGSCIIHILFLFMNTELYSKLMTILRNGGRGTYSSITSTLRRKQHVN